MKMREYQQDKLCFRYFAFHYFLSQYSDASPGIKYYDHLTAIIDKQIGVNAGGISSKLLKTRLADRG
jgi:hypothetical protein